MSIKVIFSGLEERVFLFVCMCRCDLLCGIILFSGNYSSEVSLLKRSS